MIAELETLLNDTEAQLADGLDAMTAGCLVDLGDLVPRVDRVCTLAVDTRARDAAPRLSLLIERLDRLQRLLRERIAESADSPPRPDPARAAAHYRAAAPLPEAEG